MQFFADASFDFAGDVNGQFNAGLVFCHVEECFVDGERFDEVGVVVEDVVYLHGHLFIYVHTPGYEDKFRTEFHGTCGSHRRTNSELACLVAGGGYNAPFFAPADGNGFAAQRGIVALLHGSVKGIHVDVYDFA